MLTLLQIKNFLMIEDTQISFKDGFTAVTGETGAGKSIFISAFLLVLGEKLLGKKFIKQGLIDDSTIIAPFDISNNVRAVNYLNDLSIKLTGELIIRRNIYKNGKSKFFMNDISVSVQALSNFKEIILEMCGQHSSRSLLEKENHVQMLDEYSDNLKYLHNLSHLFKCLKNEENNLKYLIDKKKKAEDEKDFLKTLIADLTRLNTFIGEEDDLIDKRKNIAQQYKITETISKVSEHFSKLCYIKNLHDMQKHLGKYEELFHKILTPLRNSISELKEFEAQLEDISESYNDTLNMEQIENRLYKIRSLARKYGTMPRELPQLLVNKQMEIDEIENLDFLIKQSFEKVNTNKQSYLKLAKQVSSSRKLSACKLKSKIESCLEDLKMNKVEVLIQVEEHKEADKWSAKGIDKVEFLIRTNQGQSFTEMGKTSSGGELSRIMLSIMLALSEKNTSGIVIFDEIDTGISGSVSSAIGKKLHELSRTVQVIAITHQPQVTAFSHNHIHVSKVSNSLNTIIFINILNNEESLGEIARMISGEKITDKSLAAAQSLIDESKIV